ncbi:MAG: alpha/beta hydrolase [Pseudomonadota bacterium]
MSADDMQYFAHPPADKRIYYGSNELQFGDLRLPSGNGLYPVILVIHGRCWRAKYALSYADALMQAFPKEGFATWSIEYLRVGNDGGGWPGTFADIANGADHLNVIAAEHRLDLNKTVAMGHSAGGHFALWLAARSQLPPDASGFAKTPLNIAAVLALAPAPDLAHLHEKQLCGHVIYQLMGGSPDQFPERFKLSDPMQLAPDAPLLLVIGAHDAAWAPVDLRYADHAEARGDDVTVVDAPLSGHFEMVDPRSST